MARPPVISEDAYFREHGGRIEESLSNAVSLAIAERALDPVLFVGQQLMAEPNRLQEHVIAQLRVQLAEAQAELEHMRGAAVGGRSYVQQEAEWSAPDGTVSKELRVDVTAGAIAQIGPLLIEQRSQEQQVSELEQSVAVVATGDVYLQTRLKVRISLARDRATIRLH